MKEYITQTKYECIYCGKYFKSIDIMIKHLDEFEFMSDKNIVSDTYRFMFFNDFIKEVCELFEYNIDFEAVEKPDKGVYAIIQFPFDINNLYKGSESYYNYKFEFKEGVALYIPMKAFLVWIVDFVEKVLQEVDFKIEYLTLDMMKRAKESILYKRLMEVSANEK